MRRIWNRREWSIILKSSVGCNNGIMLLLGVIHSPKPSFRQGRKSDIASSPFYSINNMIRESTEFYDKTSNIRKKRSGIRVGNYLCVSNVSVIEERYKIFRVREGLPLVNAYFRNQNHAVEFAQYIDRLFSDYFVIWEEYPHADLFSLVKWTVKDGVRWYETMKILRKKKELELEDIAYAYSLAERHADEWIAIG